MNRKLTADQVARIRAMLKTRKYPARLIAERFGVSQSAINAIKYARAWRGVG